MRTECQAQWLAMGGSAFAGEQVIPDTGEKFELFHVLTDSLTALTMRSFVQIQEEAIKKLETWVQELTTQLDAISRRK